MTAGDAIVTFLELLAAVVVPSVAILAAVWLLFYAYDLLRERW